MLGPYRSNQPPDLPQRLLSHGFTTEGELEAIMVAEMSTLPDEYWTMDVSAVSRITTPEGVDAIVRMESEVWGKETSGFSAGMKYDLVHHPDRLQHHPPGRAKLDLHIDDILFY